jgi:hypothetical protein
MSADNYWLVCKTSDGKFVAVMGFASEPAYPEVDPEKDYVEFDDPVDALNWAIDQRSEYGVSLHPECTARKLSKSDQA